MAGRNTREKYETGMSLLVSGPSAACHAPGGVNSIHRSNMPILSRFVLEELKKIL